VFGFPINRSGPNYPDPRSDVGAETEDELHSNLTLMSDEQIRVYAHLLLTHVIHATYHAQRDDLVRTRKALDGALDIVQKVRRLHTV
jgi:hypothetical protein